jgi:large subunit ribosomal protein L31
MREKIHPTYYADAKIVCASCGNTWTTGSTKKEIHVEVCSNCHPFFSGEAARILDVEGQVDRFYKKLQARQSYVEDQKAREEAKSTPNVPVAELGLSARVNEALINAGIATVAQAIEKLEQGGDEALLAIDGFGRKSLIDLKKKARTLGFNVPEATTAE